MNYISDHRLKKHCLLLAFLVMIYGNTAGQQVKQAKNDTIIIDTLNLPWNIRVPMKYYTGAVSVITGQEMARFRVANNTNMLAGRLAGLMTNMGSAEPGSDNSNLSVRGSSSYYSGSPKIYVDNMSIGFDQLDPLEIDQLVVLKDAAANASYGIQGADKSIVVTTRRGVPFQNKISFYSQFGFVTPSKGPVFLGAKDYMTLYNEANINDGITPFYPQATINQYDNPSRNKELYPDVDWQKELIAKQAMQQKYNITFSGGNNDVRYFILGGYMKQGGLYKYGDLNEKSLGFNTNPGFTRYNFRSNLDFKINSTLSVSLNLAGRLESKNYPGASASAIWSNIAIYPPNLFPMLYADGKIGGYNQGGLDYRSNPYGLITQSGYNREVHRNLTGTTSIVQKLDKWVPGLSAFGSFSYYNFNYNNEGASMAFATYNMQADGTYQKYNNDVPYAFRGRGQDQDRMTTVVAKLDYQHAFGKNHEVSANLGFNQTVENAGSGFMALSSLIPGLPSGVTIGDNFPYATQGFFSYLHYAYQKKYIVDLNMSYNGSENLAPGKRFGFFPTLAAGWIISEEDFLKKTKVDLLKLRASYGLLGNSDFSFLDRAFGGRNRYLYASAYTFGSNYALGRNPIFQSSRAEGAIANPDVTWETSKVLNIGIDGAFFGNKLGVTVDAFQERRSNILAFPSSQSSLIGVAFKPLNVGKVVNKGVEWDVNYTDKIGNLHYTAHALGSYVKNKIIFQDEVVRPYSYMNRTGLPIGTIFGLESIGFFNSQEEINNSPLQTYGPVQPGDLKYKDQNGDGRIDQNDGVAIGKPFNAQFTYGAQINLKYKSVDLTVWFQGTGKRSVNIMNAATFGLAGGAKPSEYVLNRWTPATAATADYPRLSNSAKQGDNNYVYSSFWNQNGQYLRIKNVELGYNFSPSILKSLRISNARFYVSANNLATWTKLKADYIDPEYTSAGISDYPRTRTFVMGLNVEF
ncbi:SusC/RagA family TonB-linked outer membrane protein [Pedobacter sp. PAMC26386]|nr:SusC/RagA family TonB-linked outer membrane protein [Pedobacter sp. PAMC26386]